MGSPRSDICRVITDKKPIIRPLRVSSTSDGNELSTNGFTKQSSWRKELNVGEGGPRRRSKNFQHRSATCGMSSLTNGRTGHICSLPQRYSQSYLDKTLLDMKHLGFGRLNVNNYTSPSAESEGSNDAIVFKPQLRSR